MTEYDCTTDSYDGVEICFMGSCDGFCVISGEMWVYGQLCVLAKYGLWMVKYDTII